MGKISRGAVWGFVTWFVVRDPAAVIQGIKPSVANAGETVPASKTLGLEMTGHDRGCVGGPVLARHIALCIDRGLAPRTCLATSRPDSAGALPLCDVDGDGLADAFEDALGSSYAFAFAYNEEPEGGVEPHWPDNVGHYVENSHLIWRSGSNEDTVREVIPKPTLTSLATASLLVDGEFRSAASPGIGQGSNFWLCMDRPNGSYTADSLVTSKEASRTLKGGIDVSVVVHPTDADPNGRYVFVANMLYYSFNRHSFVDDHEGDWEGAGAIVDTETGDVVGAYFGRHGSADDERLVMTTGPGARRVVDPRAEEATGDVCDTKAAGRAHGLRFWDHAGLRHHPVVYVATGGHASFDYPGNTKVQGAPGCFRPVMVRDTHNGNGYKFLPWREAFVRNWEGSPEEPVTERVHFTNLGEENAPAVAWAAYRGQWGCHNDLIAKSYAGPWDNERRCRRWLTHGWGTQAPFHGPSPSSSCARPKQGGSGIAAALSPSKKG